MTTADKQPFEVLIFSGAGLSAESGVSTFRDTDGIWKKYNINIVCNEGTWRDNLDAVHEFYNTFRSNLVDKEPNAAHTTIAQLQKEYGERCHIVTQNVDDLLERAGCHDVLHVHGFIQRMKCEDCGRMWDVGYSSWNPQEDRCTCGSQEEVRPDIVFFGGMAPEYMTMYDLFDRITSCERNVVIVVGTEGGVVPINAILKGTKCQKILCNLVSNPKIDESQFAACYFETATTALPKIQTWLAEYEKNLIF